MKCSVVSPGSPGILLAVAVATCLIVITHPARADDPAPTQPVADNLSRDLMDRGFAALKRNDLEGAHAAFAEAWQLHPHVVVGMSLAEVEMRLGLLVDAAEHWQYLLLNLPADMIGERDSARRQLDICRSTLGSVTLQVTPDGSSVVVDDKPVGKSPLGREVLLEPGAHSVYAVQDGRRSIGRSFRVSAGGRLSFNLAIPGAADPATARAGARPTSSVSPATTAASGPIKPAEHSGAGLRIPLVIAGGATALAAAAVGAYFAVESNNASDDAAAAQRAVEEQGDPTIAKASLCAGRNRPAACGPLASSIVDVVRFRNLSIGTFIGAGVLAAGTVATMVLWKGSPTRHLRDENTAQLTVAPLLGPLNGFSASGRF